MQSRTMFVTANSRVLKKNGGKKIPNVANPITIRGLEGGTTYYFVISTVSESGESEISEEISYAVDYMSEDR